MDNEKKRKFDESTSIVDSLKKVRITRSAGELRLKRDLKDCEDLQRSGFVKFVRTQQDDPMRFRMIISGCPLGTLSVQVPRFYPHKPPAIFAENFCGVNQFVKRDGLICIPMLTDEWLATFTFRDVVGVLCRYVGDGCHISGSTPATMMQSQEVPAGIESGQEMSVDKMEL